MSQDALSGPDLAGVVSDVPRHGIVDVLRGGVPPLDFETVAEGAFEVEFGAQRVRIAGLRSVVGFKRLADRPRDRNDLAELESLHGELPVDPIPGLDR